MFDDSVDAFIDVASSDFQSPLSTTDSVEDSVEEPFHDMVLEG